MAAIGAGLLLAAVHGHAVQAEPAPAAPTPERASAARCPPRRSVAAIALSYRPNQPRVEAWLVPLTGQQQAPVRLASLARVPDSPVTGTIIPGTSLAAVTVSPHRQRDPTWGGALYVLSPDQQPRLLVNGVQAGGSLAAAPGGPVLAIQGSAGAERAAGDPARGYRRDSLQLVAIDPRSGDRRVVRAEKGDAMFLLGVVGNEALLYRVGVGQEPAARAAKPDAPGVPADFAAVDLASGAVRVVQTPAPPLARDFSLDADRRTLWFTALRPEAPGDQRWTVQALDLASGRLAVAAAASSMGLAPRALSDDRVAYSCAGGDGICFAAVGAAAGKPEPSQHPLGPGRVELQAAVCTEEGAILLGVQSQRGPFATPFVWDASQSSASPVTLPASRVLFVGVIPTASKQQ